MKKRIIIVTSEFGKQGGGLSTSASNLFQLLVDLNFVVEVIISSQHSNQIIEKSNKSIFHNKIVISSGGYNSRLQSDLFFRGHLNNTIFYLKHTKPDLIISFGAGLNGLFASELSSKLNSKLVIMPRGSELNLAISNSDLYYYNKKCLSKASSVVSVSNELIERSKEIYYSPFCIYKVIPNAINFCNFNSIKNGDSEIILGTGAKFLNEKKGIFNLIYALYILNNMSSNKFNLNLCGFIDEDLKDSYQELIEKLKLNQNITFVGSLTRAEFLLEIQNWDIALQTSICEGFSNSIGDAISVGISFMISNTGYIAEQIFEDFPELVFDNLTPESIAEKIYNAYFNNDIKQLCEGAIGIIKHNVSKESIYREWKDFIDVTLSDEKQIPISINTNSVISLMLHEISDTEFSGVDLPINKFTELCFAIKQKGYTLCSAVEYFNSENKSNLIICTFDDGYKSVYKFAFPILKKYSFTATVFVCPKHMGKSNDWNPKDKLTRFHMTLDELLKLKEEGWEIGSHGIEHISFHRLDEKEILQSVIESKMFLEKHFGEIHSFAYPYGDTSAIIETIVKQHYSNIFTTNLGGTHVLLDRHRIKRYLFDELQSLFKK